MTLRQKLEQLIASWPDDRGDKPDTNYQRGYIAAAEEHARELADALRTPAAAVGEGAVERVAQAIEDALCEYIDYLRAPREHTAGMANQMVMNAARAALAAMPGAGVADAALRAVMGLNSVRTLFEAAEEYPHGQEDVAAELAALKLARAALSAAPPSAAESRAGEVEAKNADGCPHCGSEFLGGDEENYPGWACGSYRMDNGQIVQEGDCERRELKRLLSEAPVPEPAAGERGE